MDREEINIARHKEVGSRVLLMRLALRSRAGARDGIICLSTFIDVLFRSSPWLSCAASFPPGIDALVPSCLFDSRLAFHAVSFLSFDRFFWTNRASKGRGGRSGALFEEFVFGFVDFGGEVIAPSCVWMVGHHDFSMCFSHLLHGCALSQS